MGVGTVQQGLRSPRLEDLLDDPVRFYLFLSRKSSVVKLERMSEFTTVFQASS